jgi:hypothetical protein
VELRGIDVTRSRKLDDGVERQRLDGQPLYGRPRRNLAEHDTQRVQSVELVVPVRRDDEHARLADLPGQ